MWRFSGFGNEAPIGSIVARRATPFAGTKLELFSRKAVVPLVPAVDDFFWQASPSGLPDKMTNWFGQFCKP